MKTNIIAITGIGLLVLFALAFTSVFEIRLASAQIDATSSTTIDPSLSTTSPESITLASSTNTVVTDPEASTATSSQPESAPATSTLSIESPPQGLTKVHIIGTKYTDYFTDGKTVTAFPGDPAIDSNFDKPDAPIPTHEGLTWDHTDGGYLYDTPSGDLEVGDYAVQPSGSYIKNAPPFVSSTSTPAQLTTTTLDSTANDTSSTSSSVASPSVPDASTSPVAATLDSSTSTRSADSTTSPTAALTISH
jgi:serine-aspartate repeat-containing protein C/D/E